MTNSPEVLELLNKGVIPELQDVNIEQLCKSYIELSSCESDIRELFLLAVEKFYNKNSLSDEIKNFDDFFKVALLFQRDKNDINRFFDAALGLRTPGNLAKMDEITEEKRSGHQEELRIKGSFEYAHTQTHYSLLIDIFNYLRPNKNEVILDIGSGYGRLGLFIGLCFPEVHYLGLEIVQERVDCSNEVARKNAFKNINFEVQDVLAPNYPLPRAQYYYFYDPLEPQGLEKVSLDLMNQNKLNSSSFRIIALTGYDDEVVNHFNSLDWLEPIHPINDKFFQQSGVIYQTINT